MKSSQSRFNLKNVLRPASCWSLRSQEPTKLQSFKFNNLHLVACKIGTLSAPFSKHFSNSEKLVAWHTCLMHLTETIRARSFKAFVKAINMGFYLDMANLCLMIKRLFDVHSFQIMGRPISCIFSLRTEIVSNIFLQFHVQFLRLILILIFVCSQFLKAVS